MAKPKERADSHFLTGRQAVGPILYALTFKTITQNSLVCGVISRNWSSTGWTPFPIAMLVLGYDVFGLGLKAVNHPANSGGLQ